MSAAPAFEIRQLRAADAESFSRLRREVTAVDPVNMGLTLEEELTRPIEKFREQLSYAEPNAAFGAFVNGELVGTAAVAWPSRLPSSRHKVNLWGVFVSPRFRGRGIARALVETRGGACPGQRRAAGEPHRLRAEHGRRRGSMNRWVSGTSAPSRRRSGSATAITTAIS